MKTKKILSILLMVITALALVSCASSGTTVTRTSSDEVVDLSGRWNDTDSRLAAEEMVSGMLSGYWLGEFVDDNGRKPVVVVGSIRNKSSEHIETETFIKDIERELINGGSVKFVASKMDREDLRDEKEDQQSNATEESAKALAQETGADLMLMGVFTVQTDQVDGKKAVLYKLDMELIDIQSNEKKWLDTYTAKKLISRSKSSW